jgi:hypothetical protein
MDMTRRETVLAITAALLGAIAMLGPHVGEPPGYQQFADQRMGLGIAHAADVLSNIGFLVAGAIGAWSLWRVPARALGNMERAMAALFFAGLVTTALCSAWYHLQPDASNLVIDRTGMAIAFAGLLGLCAATHVSGRAGAAAGPALLLAAAAAIRASAAGELLPWAVLQFGGMAMVCAAAFTRPVPFALRVNWLAVVAIYAVAKLAEMNDAAVFELANHLVSGHTLKHLVAAIAAWPVIAALRECACVQNVSDPRRVPA